MDRILTVADTVSLGVIVDAAQHNSKVARANSDGEVTYGTARSVGNETFAFLKKGEDVRDAFLRVTTRGGFEAAWKVSELMDEVHTGEFAKYDW